MTPRMVTSVETEKTLRTENVLRDDRLPVKWDGEYVHWASFWTDTGMLFLCRSNDPLKEQACPDTDERRRRGRNRPHLWKPRTIMGRTTRIGLRLMRCGVCGLTLVEERPLEGGKDTLWQLDETDYGPEGSHAIIQGEFDFRQDDHGQGGHEQ